MCFRANGDGVMRGYRNLLLSGCSRRTARNWGRRQVQFIRNGYCMPGPTGEERMQEIRRLNYVLVIDDEAIFRELQQAEGHDERAHKA